MFRRSFAIFAVFLCLSTSVALAQSSKESYAAVAETLDINWEATSRLIFLPLANVSLTPGSHEAQVRIQDQGQPLFFESVSFEVGASKVSAAAAPMGLQILSDHRDERAWLLDRLARGAQADVEVLVDGGLVFFGSFEQLVADSDTLRDGMLRPVGTTATFVDMRAERNAQKLCEEDCYEDYNDCLEDFCYWYYDEYMCHQGCVNERDECLDVADPACPLPVCTPGVISTDTDTVLIGSQNVGLGCLRDIYNPNSSVYYHLINLTYRVTTRELRRNADCTTTWVTTDTSTHTRSCQQRTSIPCGFAWVYPACVI